MMIEGSAEEIISRLHLATAGGVTDWNMVRGVYLALDTVATTKEQKDAVARLGRAAPGIGLGPIVVALEGAFLRGKPGVDGWPRR